MSEAQIEVGKYVNTFGIKGEIKIFPYVEYFEDLKQFTMRGKEYKISKMRQNKNVYIVKLKEIDDINDIENLKGSMITINKSDKPEPPEGEYYKEDLIGFDVITDEGKNLGQLDDIFNTGANDIYQVGKILLPGIEEVIKEINPKKRQIIVHIIKGLI